MVTVHFIQLLQSVADLCGLDRDNIHNDDEQIIRAALNRRLGLAWDAYYWPDIMDLEERTYRADYSASETLTAATTTAVAERFFPQTKKCYQALRNMPLTASSITRSGTTATVTTSADHLLSTGDQTTVSGAAQAGYNITATATVTGATTFTYVLESDPGSSATGTLKVGVNPANVEDETQERYWAVCKESYGATVYARATAYVVGDQVYYPPTDRSYQCITDAAAGLLPTNTTYFAPLTDFDRYIAYEQSGETKIGDVVGVYSKSPRVWRNASRVAYDLSPNGIQVLDDWDTVWVEFKAKVPVLIGDTFSSASTYTANLDQVYYRSTSTPSSYPGNMYDCVTTTSAGDSPESAAAKWSIVNIPRIFQRYLERGAYADYLVADGQAEKAMIEESRAKAMLDELVYKVAATQNQVRKTIVLTR
jgi:hypothetical protein